MSGFAELEGRIERRDVIILDGCRGMGVESIRPLREALPARVPAPRKRGRG